MSIAEGIKNWKGKPKELVLFLTQKKTNEQTRLSEIIELLRDGSKTERGTAADVIEETSKAKPELFELYIDTLIGYVNDKLPRVKWGTQEALGNLSQKYPTETAKAIPKLLQNTIDDSTVVKWHAAYALTEIAKNNPLTQQTLVPKMQEIAEEEKNNGVKNV